jgi:hypothetical protein
LLSACTRASGGPSRRGEPDGFSRLAGPFVAMAVRRVNRDDLAALKVRLETAG